MRGDYECVVQKGIDGLWVPSPQLLRDHNTESGGAWSGGHFAPGRSAASSR